MSDITIEGKNLHDIDQTNFQSVGPYTDENQVIEPWQGRNVINGEEQDNRFELGTYTENNRDFWEFNTINSITRKSQFSDKKLHIVDTNITDDGFVISKEQKWSVDSFTYVRRNGENYPLYFYYDKNLNKEEHDATTEGEINLRFELRASGRSTLDSSMDNFVEREPFRPFLLSAILSGSLLRKDRWQDSEFLGEGFYQKGTNARIEILPSEFSHFLNWTDLNTNEELGGESVYQFNMPQNDVEIVANVQHNTVIKANARTDGQLNIGGDIDLRISDEPHSNTSTGNFKERIDFSPDGVETLSAPPPHRILLAVKPNMSGIVFNGWKVVRGSGNEVSFDPYHDYHSTAGTGPGDPHDNPNDIYDGAYFKYFEVAPTQIYEDDGLDELQYYADFRSAYFMILNQNSSFERNIRNVMIKGLGDVFVNGVDQGTTLIPLNNENGLTFEAVPDTGFTAKTIGELNLQTFSVFFPREDYDNGSTLGPSAFTDERKQFILDNETTGSITHQFEQEGMFVDIELQSDVEIQTLPNASQIIRPADTQFEYNMYAATSELSFSVRSVGDGSDPLLSVKYWGKDNSYDGEILSSEFWQDHGIGTVTNSNVTTVTFNVPTVDEINDRNGLDERQSRFYRFIFDSELTQESITGDDGDDDLGGDGDDSDGP